MLKFDPKDALNYIIDGAPFNMSVFWKSSFGSDLADRAC